MSGDITGVSLDEKDILYQAIEEVIVGKGADQVILPDAWLTAIKNPGATLLGIL